MGVDEGVGKRVVGFRRRETECDLGVFYEQQVVDLEMGRSDLCQVFLAESSISLWGEKTMMGCPKVRLRASFVREVAAARALRQGCHPWTVTSSSLES